jgi:hypothetical protein
MLLVILSITLHPSSWSAHWCTQANGNVRNDN